MKKEKEKSPQNQSRTLKWQIPEAVISTLFFLLIEAMMIHTEGGLPDFLHLGSRKLILVAMADAAFLILLLWGHRLCSLIENTFIFKCLDWLLLFITPLVMFVVVQMSVQLCELKSVSQTSFLRIMKASVAEISFDNVIRNLILYYFILLLLLLLIRKVNIACVIYCVLLLLLALVNYYVSEFRGSAFLLLDAMGTGTAVEVAGEYRLDIPVYLGLLLLLTLDFCKFQIHFQKISLLGKIRKKLPCILFQCGIFVLLGYASVSAVRKAPNVSFWNTNRSYCNLGYLSSLASETRYLTAEKPDGYSTSKVQKVAEEVPEETPAAASVVPENIIMIMNESLTDFESVGDVKSSEEILPFIHSLNKNVKHGQLHVPTFGGGTSRSEYEALTGNSMYFLPAGSIPYQLYIHGQESGMAEILKSQGYSTIAMHPNKASNWNRTKVYDGMGFDEFISFENWGTEDTETIRNFVSDQATYNKIMKMYDQKESGKKLFTFCVTMQNHGGYDSETLNGYEPDISLHYKRSYPKAETYLSLAHESDKAFRNLLEHFEKVEEPTMIIMFGDHWPKIESRFMSEVLGKNKQNLNLEETQQTYTTPYVIWTNYSSDTLEQDISSNYLGSYVLEQAGLELPAYNRFLLSLKKELPIIGVGAVCDSEGNWYAQDQLPEKYEKLVTDYNILEYNNQFDEKNKLTGFFTCSE